MADAAAGGDISGWVQIGGVIGAILGGAYLVVRGRLGEANTAISQTRAEATDVFTRETQANREVLQAIREAVLGIHAGITAMREQNNRIVTCQEAIVKIMQEQAEDAKFVERTARLMDQLSEREREERHRPMHR